MALPEAVGGKRSPADHGVHAAYPDRLRGDLHLPRGRNGHGDIDDLQAIGVSERPDHDGFHLCSSGWWRDGSQLLRAMGVKPAPRAGASPAKCRDGAAAPPSDRNGRPRPFG